MLYSGASCALSNGTTQTENKRMKTTKNGNYAVWTQAAHKHNGRIFPKVVITGKLISSEHGKTYKPFKIQF